MKKKLLTFILVGTMLTAASVIGCGKSAQDAQTSANTETKADTETVAEDNADSETGSVQINGGIENDGIDLMEDDGLYRTVTLDDYPVYYSVGKVTLPLSEDVTFEDQAAHRGPQRQRGFQARCGPSLLYPQPQRGAGPHLPCAGHRPRIQPAGQKVQ